MMNSIARLLSDDAVKDQLDALGFPETAYLGLLTVDRAVIEQEMELQRYRGGAFRSFDDAQEELLQVVYSSLKRQGKSVLKEVSGCVGYERILIRLCGSKLKPRVRWNFGDDQWPLLYTAGVWADKCGGSVIRLIPIEDRIPIPYQPEVGDTLYLHLHR